MDDDDVRCRLNPAGVGSAAARINPRLYVGAAASHFDADGNLTDPEIRSALMKLLEALRAWTLRVRIREAA